MPERLDYLASCRRLYELGLHDCEPAPRMPERMPRYDDEERLGVSLFRTRVEGDLSDLSLPRTFVGRSEIRDASFKNCDLTESSLCWNDFINVDFGKAILRGCDLRASIYERVCFDDADLSLADLRGASFDFCTFEGTAMGGAILSRTWEGELTLSQAQRTAIDWRDDDGEAPGGG